MSEQTTKREIAGWNPMQFGQEPGKHVESRVVEFNKGSQRWRMFKLFVPYPSKRPEDAGRWVPGYQFNAKPQAINELVQRINEVIATACPEMGGQFVFQPGPMAAALRPLGPEAPAAPQQMPMQYGQQQPQYGQQPQGYYPPQQPQGYYPPQQDIGFVPTPGLHPAAGPAPATPPAQPGAVQGGYIPPQGYTPPRGHGY